jgi:hypothetical protein
MDEPSSNDFVYIDSTKLSIPAKDAIASDLKNLLSTVKQQKEKLYNFSVSPNFKRVEEAHKPEMDRITNGVILKLQDKLDSMLTAFKLLGMRGGGLMSKLFGTSGTKIPLSDMEMLLSNLEESTSSEFKKFNSLISMISTYTMSVDKNDIEKSNMLLDLILTKLETFNSITNEIVSIIKQYNKSGGSKSKTAKHTKRTKRATKRTKRRL